MYRLVYRRMEVNEDDQLCNVPDLAELPDCYALTDQQKTTRIQELEREVTILSSQLIGTRNKLNSLLTEMERYKQVHGQVSWLLDQFKNTLSEVHDKPRFEAILPPPLSPRELPLSLPLPPPPPSTVGSNDYTDKDVLTIDLTTSKTSQTLSEGTENESEDDQYSDDWETTDEVTASESTASVAAQTTDSGVVTQTTDSGVTEQPLTNLCPPDLAQLLANANTKTHISEIFRKLYSSENSQNKTDSSN